MQGTNPITTFETFFAGWMIRQEIFLQELHSTMHQLNPKKTQAESQAQMSNLITRISAHYHEYFTAKSRLAQHNILLLFSPPWLTPFEKTFLWIAGFKPGLAFHLVKTFITDLNQSQQSEIDKARVELKLEERDLMEELTRIQETIAAPPMMEMVRRGANEVEGEVVEMELEELKNDMEELVECADFLRVKTVMRIMEILSSGQSGVFFAAVGKFQLQVRRWGFELQDALN